MCTKVKRVDFVKLVKLVEEDLRKQFKKLVFWNRAKSDNNILPGWDYGLDPLVEEGVMWF